MNTPQRENPHYTLVQKLDPINFPKMPGILAALLGFVLDVVFVQPKLEELKVADGLVLARPEGHVAPHYLGQYNDLLKNWLALLAAAHLTRTEYIEAQLCFARKVGFYPDRTTA